MAIHYIAVTIDTDPDGLNTQNPNRRDLSWVGLEFAFETFPMALADYPLTWYVRADGQLEAAYGSSRYLLDSYADFWRAAVVRGDELGWHPHLYTVPEDESAPEIITDSAKAVLELRRIWEMLRDYDLELPTFRMGEGWHSSETLNRVESLGFPVDSTAIPNRDDSASGHPRNWKNAPNQPYYPQYDDIRHAGTARPMLEVPMNSWYFQASYDKAPKLRYMNPAVHTALWEQGLEYLVQYIKENPAETYVWVLIFHPAEASPLFPSDMLYGRSVEVLRQNLLLMAQKIQALGDETLFSTLNEAAQHWRKSRA